MPQKQLLLSALALLITTSTSWALSFYAGQFNAPEGERNLKWTTCIWGDNINFETKPLPTKPGPNDSAGARFGDYVLDVDTDINIAQLYFGDNSTITSTGRTLKVKRGVLCHLSTRDGGSTNGEFKNSVLEIGGTWEFRLWHEARSAGLAKLSLIDSKMFLKNDISTFIPANALMKNSQRAGVVIALTGKSILKVDGGVVLDDIIKESPSEWMFRMSFTEKDGNVPTATFAKKANLDGCDIEINVSENVKAGKFCLLEFAHGRSGIGKTNKITLNNESYTLGEPIKIGNKTIKVMLAPFGRDTRNANDIVMEVK